MTVTVRAILKETCDVFVVFDDWSNSSEWGHAFQSGNLSADAEWRKESVERMGRDIGQKMLTTLEWNILKLILMMLKTKVEQIPIEWT
jgi:hypothetical protein